MHRGVFLWILGIDFAPQGIQTVRIFGLKYFLFFGNLSLMGTRGGRIYNRISFAGIKPAVSWKRLKMGWATPENKSDGGSDIRAKTNTNRVISTFMGGERND
jgi:hypothetical protein